MNYYKTKNREKFLKYWEGNISKKLFRCSKEYGFYPILKKVMGRSDTNKRINFLTHTLNALLVELNRDKKGVVTFSDLDRREKKLKYPVYTALHSKLHLSHLFALCVLQNCNISHQALSDSFQWLTDEIIEKNKNKAAFIEVTSYIKLFFTL
jgi:hypothetical protein